MQVGWVVILLAGLTRLICVLSAGGRPDGPVFLACTVSDSLSVCLGISWVLTGWGLFMWGWFGAIQFCFLGLILLQSSMGGSLAKAEGQEWKQASVCKWSANIVFANIPMAKACHMAKSRDKGRLRIGSVSGINLSHLASPYSSAYLLCMDFTQKFRGCRFFGGCLYPTLYSWLKGPQTMYFVSVYLNIQLPVKPKCICLRKPLT